MKRGWRRVSTGGAVQIFPQPPLHKVSKFSKKSQSPQPGIWDHTSASISALCIKIKLEQNGAVSTHRPIATVCGGLGIMYWYRQVHRIRAILHTDTAITTKLCNMEESNWWCKYLLIIGQPQRAVMNWNILLVHLYCFKQEKDSYFISSTTALEINQQLMNNMHIWSFS